MPRDSFLSHRKSGRSTWVVTAAHPDVGFEDGAFFAALVRMYEQALKSSAVLPRDERDAFFERLDVVRRVCDNFGYGVGDDMQVLFAEYVSDDR